MLCALNQVQRTAVTLKSFRLGGGGGAISSQGGREYEFLRSGDGEVSDSPRGSPQGETALEVQRLRAKITVDVFDQVRREPKASTNLCFWGGILSHIES